jgi:hypothetical protein
MAMIVRCLSALVLTLGMLACSAVEVPGETKADAALKKTATDTIKQLELAYGCSTLFLTVTDSKVVVPFDGKHSVEKWTIKSCNGETHYYEVNFVPSPAGGTDVGVRKLEK